MIYDFKIDGIALGMEVVDRMNGQRGQVTGIAVYRFSTNTARVESTKDGKVEWVDIARLKLAPDNDIGLGSHASKDPA